MKLILQAIKALFRKVENALEKVKESLESVRGEIPQNLDDLLNGEKISGNRVEDMYYSTWLDFSAEVETVESGSKYLAENIGEIFGNANVMDGKTFQIIFDGTSYEIAFKWQDDQGGFGDHRFYEQGTAEGLECKYPFYLYRKNSGGDYMWHIATLTGGLHTIEVKKVAEEITPIDKKFFPSDYLPSNINDGKSVYTATYRNIREELIITQGSIVTVKFTSVQTLTGLLYDKTYPIIDRDGNAVTLTTVKNRIYQFVFDGSNFILMENITA